MKLSRFLLGLLAALLLCQCLQSQEVTPVIYPFAKQGKWGLIDENKKVLIQPSFQYIRLPDRMDEKDLVYAAKQEERWGAIDQTGKVLIPYEYHDLRTSFKSGELVKVITDRKHGLVSYKTGEVVYPIELDKAPVFFGYKLPVAIIKKGGQTAAINGKGKMIVDFGQHKIHVLDKSSDFPDLEITSEGAEPRYVDCWGESKSAKEMQDILIEDRMWANTMISEEVSDNPAKPNTEAIEIDSKPALLVTTKYGSNIHAPPKQQIDTLINVTDALFIKTYIDYKTNKPGILYAICKRDGKIGILNEDNEVITPFEYDRIIQSVDDDPCHLYKGRLRGASNSYGELLVDAVFTSFRKAPKPGLYVVEHPDGYYGYVSMQGVVFLPIDESKVIPKG